MSTATIKITHADGRVEERVFGPGSYEVGRESGQLVLPDHNVSARHARLDVQAERVVLIDLGSSNGTYSPSGDRLSGPYELHPGHAVRLGGSTLTLLARPGAGGTQAMPQLGGVGHAGRPSDPLYPAPAGLGAPAAAAVYGSPGVHPAYPAPASPDAIELRRLADRWMILAIVSVFCGCGLPGIINIVLVSQAKSALEQNDLEAARSKLGIVKILCIMGWAILAATLLFIVVVYGGIFAALMTGPGAPRY